MKVTFLINKIEEREITIKSGDIKGYSKLVDKKNGSKNIDWKMKEVNNNSLSFTNGGEGNNKMITTVSFDARKKSLEVKLDSDSSETLKN